MAQIIAICKEHKIAFIADFALDDGLHCASADLRDDHEPSENQIKAFDLLKRKPHFAMAVTTETKPNGDKKITMQRLS